MEQKTIGKFITALRKANGMTQKELAEKLGVSDKTVSRWERDEGSPDLSAIPVIAEIFGVTCDELLRGERKSLNERKTESMEISSRGEKQRQRILSMSLSKYRNRSFISIGLSVIGLIAAMICNMGFNRAYLGFLFGAVLYVVSVVYQAISVNGAFVSVSNDDLSDMETNRFKISVISFAKKSFCTTAVLLGVILPLIVVPMDGYVGLTSESWFRYGAAYGIIALIICAIVCYFLNAYLIKKEIYFLDEKKKEVFTQNRKLKKTCAIAVIILFAITFAVHSFANARWSAWALADGEVFNDYESFVEYMEQDVPYYTGSGFLSEEVAAPPEYGVYYDEFGNEIPEEEALREEVRIADGSREGKVVCEYVHRNETVTSVRPGNSDTGLPIIAITHDGYERGKVKNNIMNYFFVGGYGLEALGVCIYYMKKRVKITK